MWLLRGFRVGNVYNFLKLIAKKSAQEGTTTPPKMHHNIRVVSTTRTSGSNIDHNTDSYINTRTNS